MAIKRLKATNFRSFKELDIELGPFTVLVGPNASGKSNVLQCLRFLRDIVVYGLEDSVSLQGGAEYLRNVHLPAATRTTLGTELVRRFHFTMDGGGEGRSVLVSADHATYTLRLEVSDSASDLKAAQEEKVCRGEVDELETVLSVSDSEVSEDVMSHPLGLGIVVLTNRYGAIGVHTDLFEGSVEPGTPHDPPYRPYGLASGEKFPPLIPFSRT